MSRTHDVTISAFDLDRLETELRAWREVAGQLATAVEHAGKPDHPSAWHTDHRCAALESYARLKSSTSTYEL